jgi:phosphohistidine phosphatase
LVLRHGEAGARIDAPEKDAERPLTPVGQREVADIATALQSLGTKFDLAASSPLKRALQTAEIVARKFKKLNQLEEWDELKPAGDTSKLFQKLSRLKTTSIILIVGHEPYLSSMIGEIVAGKTSLNLVLKKGGLAKVRINTFKPRISGELRWLLTPKMMTKMVR